MLKPGGCAARVSVENESTRQRLAASQNHPFLSAQTSRGPASRSCDCHGGGIVFQQLAELLSRHWPAEIVPLTLGTAVLLQDFKLLSRFHAFGHNPHMQTLSHPDQGRDNAGTILVGN